MLVLDTTVLSILEWSRTSPKAQRLMRRLAEDEQEIVTTIVCCEEQMRGWMSSLNRKPAMKEQVDAYRRLRQQIENYRRMVILDFDETAAVKFQELKKSKLRVGTMDLKIAAIALAHGAKVLTENTRDFRQVPGLQVEDWEKI
jgi:tRNA(fMet)-specific endonuclease VapC